MPLLKAWIDPDGIGRGESELLNHMVSNDSMSQVRWVRQSRCLIPLAQMETGVPRGTLVRMAPRTPCYLREYREDPVAWVFLAADGWSAPPSIGDYCFRSSAMQHPREGLNPSFSLGGSLPCEDCRARVG